MVSKGLVCLYILEKAEIWSGVTDASHTHSQTEYRATQLLYSIQFKLSHAMKRWGGGAVQLGYHNCSVSDEGKGLCLIKRKERLHKAHQLESLVLLLKCLITSASFIFDDLVFRFECFGDLFPGKPN